MEKLKHAVQAAQQYLAAVISDADEIRVEEVESLTENREWLITLSFLVADTPELPFGVMPLRRVYKRFRVVDGTVQSMTIRELEGA